VIAANRMLRAANRVSHCPCIYSAWAMGLRYVAPREIANIADHTVVGFGFSGSSFH